MADRPHDQDYETRLGDGRYGEDRRERGRTEGGRLYREAQERARTEREDPLLGFGYAGAPAPERERRSESAERDDRGRWRDDDRPWLPRRDFRFMERERDFPGRDDRYAGHSGMGYRPGSEQKRWIPPEEEWEAERLHYRDRAEARRGRAWEHEPLEARDVMNRSPRTVEPDSILREVAHIMADEDTGIVPVVDENRRLLGLLTDRDMVLRTVDEERSWANIRVEEVMTEDVQAVTPEEPVHDILRLMGRKQIRRLPVVDRHDTLVGMVTISELAQRAERDEDLQRAFVRISRRRSFWSRMWS
jgi:CBS domain-containing protein